MSNKGETNIKVMVNRTNELKDAKIFYRPEGTGAMIIFVATFVVQVVLLNP